MGRAFRFGRGQSRLETILPEVPLRRWLGVPRYLLRAIATQAVRRAWATFVGNPQERFAANWALHLAAGTAIEARRVHTAKNSRLPRSTVERVSRASDERRHAPAAARAISRQK
jgi:hypothetical protein